MRLLARSRLLPPATNNPFVPDNPVACAGQPKPSTLPGGGFCDDVLRSIGVRFPGTARLKGVEFEGRWAASSRLQFDASLEWTDSEYKKYIVNIVEPIAGSSDMSGNRTPRYPEWKGSAAATFTDTVPWGDATWFARADLTYLGSYFVDEANLATAPSQTLLGVQLGMSWQHLRVEAFAKNLTNEDSWAAASRWSDFTIPGVFLFSANQGVAVSPQERRRFGLRVSYRY